MTVSTNYFKIRFYEKSKYIGNSFLLSYSIKINNYSTYTIHSRGGGTYTDIRTSPDKVLGKS